jgi:hypothetical protein
MAPRLRVDMQEHSRVYRSTSTIVSVVAVPERILRTNTFAIAPCNALTSALSCAYIPAWRHVHVYTCRHLVL